MQPQEKALLYGIESLTIHELLALILRTGTKGRSVMQMAKELGFVIEKKATEIRSCDVRKVTGIGVAKTSTVLAVLELGKRIYAGKKTQLVVSPEDVWKQMQHIAIGTKEHFCVLYLNVRNQLIEREIISIGNLNTSIAHPREVFEPAVRVHAAQIILCHNHPSGSVEPSATDIETTRRLVRAGKILGIEVIDHVIITSTAFLSMKERGLL
jgi:DNA repair protein RadC